jgi:hypothetical protein
MVWRPSYNLYASNGSTLIYSFNYVQNDNSPNDTLKYTEISGIRGNGSIIIPGSQNVWDLELQLFFKGTDYQDLIAQMDSIQSTIVLGTPYILKIDRTISTTQSYNVKRLVPIRWDASYRNFYQKGVISFRVNSW